MIGKVSIDVLDFVTKGTTEIGGWFDLEVDGKALVSGTELLQPELEEVVDIHPSLLKLKPAVRLTISLDKPLVTPEELEKAGICSLLVDGFYSLPRAYMDGLPAEGINIGKYGRMCILHAWQ